MNYRNIIHNNAPANRCVLKSKIMKNIIDEVIKERERQNNKFGEQNHSPIEWIAILGEEFGECAKESVDFHFAYGIKKEVIAGMELNVESPDPTQMKRMANYRMEMIQVAAVAIQAIESLDRQSNFAFVPPMFYPDYGPHYAVKPKTECDGK